MALYRSVLAAVLILAAPEPHALWASAPAETVSEMPSDFFATFAREWVTSNQGARKALARQVRAWAAQAGVEPLEFLINGVSEAPPSAERTRALATLKTCRELDIQHPLRLPL